MTSMSLAGWSRTIASGDLDAFFREHYGEEGVGRQRERYLALLSSVKERFGDRPCASNGGAAGASGVGVSGATDSGGTGAKAAEEAHLSIFSTPGRTELGGNHTDHNNGRVLAASVHLDSLAAAFPTEDHVVELYSEGFPEPFVVDLRLLAPAPAERGRTEALIRGVASRLSALGYQIGGFRGCVTSEVLRGSGLSSSAAIEVLIGTIFNHLFNEGRIQAVTLAIVGQYAENAFFGKPCGLEDQLACATGGIIGIDFRDPAQPQVERLPFDFLEFGYTLMVVNTGGSHDDLTADYAAIPAEMRAVASAFGRSVCRDITREEVLAAIPRLREGVGDRAILRSLHFFADDARVVRQIEALEKRDIEGYLACVRESGSSSWRLLQNCASPRAAGQPIPLALAVSDELLAGAGASRVHGGGFAGTIQVYVPTEHAHPYRSAMEVIFGAGSVTPLRVRNSGTIAVLLPSRL